MCRSSRRRNKFLRYTTTRRCEAGYELVVLSGVVDHVVQTPCRSRGAALHAPCSVHSSGTHPSDNQTRQVWSHHTCRGKIASRIQRSCACVHVRRTHTQHIHSPVSFFSELLSPFSSLSQQRPRPSPFSSWWHRPCPAPLSLPLHPPPSLHHPLPHHPPLPLSFLPHPPSHPSHPSRTCVDTKPLL